MEPYVKRITVGAADVEPSRRMRLSYLFTVLTNAEIAHTEELGFTREHTLDRGFLWVVTSRHLRINRLPEYGEKIILESVPGRMMHTLYPRYERISTESGEELLFASSVWTIIDAEKREMVFPEVTGVVIDEIKPSWKTFFPVTPKQPVDGQRSFFTVPHSYTDINGHMNNSRYLDLAEDVLPDELRQRKIREVLMQYLAEAKCGEEIALDKSAGDDFRLAGSADKRLFTLNYKFE